MVDEVSEDDSTAPYTNLLTWLDKENDDTDTLLDRFHGKYRLARELSREWQDDGESVLERTPLTDTAAERQCGMFLLPTKVSRTA